MIPFNIPPFVGNELVYMKDAIENNHKLCGDGPYTKKASVWLEENFHTQKALMTTSCTHAIEMAALLLDLKEGDEVIAPSFTFVSTVNPFVLRGAKIVFVDIRPDTMNIDENLIEQAITEKTKAIIPVHYAGVSCEMDKIMDIAQRHHLVVIEDAAQGVMSKYQGKFLGTIGHMGAYSFHETKNYTMGEGGALLIQEAQYHEQAEIIREKGTNRSRFFRGQVDKYSWVEVGSSYLPSELNVAYLYAQLEKANEINEKRLSLWNRYFEGLKDLQISGQLELPFVPENCEHNAHMFYIKCKDLDERTELIDYLKTHEIQTAFHYIPLHSAEAGLKYGRLSGKDVYTTKESERLLRLPLYYQLTENECNDVIDKIHAFYKTRN
jgi:dTDP-4-amino-4,6-dideoxygalactose transaminase